MKTTLEQMPLDGLKDWSVGITGEAVAASLGDAGPYAVVLTFDDYKTIRAWLDAMMKTRDRG